MTIRHQSHSQAQATLQPKSQSKSHPKPQPKSQRSSFEIAEDFVELNFKPIIQAEAEAGMSKRQIRRLRKQEAKNNRGHHYVRYGIVAVILLIIGAVTTIAVWWSSSSEPVNAADKNTRQFVVDQGATVDDIADALHKAGFIRNTLAFRLQMRLDGGIIQAGTHMLSPSYSLKDIIKRLATADTDEIEIQILPGQTLAELKEDFKKYNYTDAEIDRALNADYNHAILASRPQGATLEGYLYPDTYRVLAGDSLETVIVKALDELAYVSDKYHLADGFAAQGLTFHQGLTLASIIAMEDHDADDQQMIAGIFYNRLNSGMSLGSDVTYKYAYQMGLCDVDLPSCDSIYNTRIHTGLTPGPIANPGLSALSAAAYPAETTYMYFVAGEDGKNYYAETVDQHNYNVAHHCGALCQ